LSGGKLVDQIRVVILNVREESVLVHGNFLSYPHYRTFQLPKPEKELPKDANIKKRP
jgi:hypothetical protein